VLLDLEFRLSIKYGLDRQTTETTVKVHLQFSVFANSHSKEQQQRTRTTTTTTTTTIIQ
jgi:hypothetical protein